ncbi:MAG: HD domain-containing protein [Firmicutes bacterium]|jgi:putative nucleotidyltransferase with HDIG domain|nr:HD domain-containing protein [Dethiobacter sp.]MBS3897577.1 HD domain-containing protein [Dethiobacter sp.]MBS3948698.1 HD domain-containing protein [Dethiobacter sp.]MCL4463815.1 HD domain-containing protein [Bacillota bacterium]MCL5993434.1 HD domain-containing protein [Bacillota bacterium]
MEVVQKLLQDPDYLYYLSLTKNYESGRRYCCHNFSHLLDVARIAWILCLERQIKLSRPVVYAAALLHDIGRFAQHEDESIDHAAESASLAEPLLTRHGFSAAETKLILQAILVHRQTPETVTDLLGAVLAEADDLSRLCYNCSAQAGCYKAKRMPTLNGIQY